MPDDLGQHVVDHVFERMKIEEKWAVREERGFTWWGGRLAQRIWTEEPVEDDGVALWRAHAQTDLLRGWSRVEKGADKLNVLARYSTVSGLLLDGKTRDTVRLRSSFYVHRQTEQDLREVLALVASMQAAEAHGMAQSLAEVARAEAAFTPHPTHGWREEPHQVLEILSGTVEPMGREPSKWAGPEMERLVQVLQEPPCVLATGDAESLTAEYAFGQQTSLLQVDTSERNPRLGNGCLVLLTLPGGEVSDRSPQAALSLNAAEQASFTRTSVLGSWCSTPAGPTHVSFLPNALYRPGRLTNFVNGAILRARWVTNEYFGLDVDAGCEAARARKLAMLEALGDRPDAR
jgi:hypothetical protein